MKGEGKNAPPWESNPGSLVYKTSACEQTVVTIKKAKNDQVMKLKHLWEK